MKDKIKEYITENYPSVILEIDVKPDSFKLTNNNYSEWISPYVINDTNYQEIIKSFYERSIVQ